MIEVDHIQVRINGSKDVLERAVLASRNGVTPARAARPMTRRASTVLLDDADFLVIDFYLVDDGPGVSAQEWRIVSQDIHRIT